MASGVGAPSPLLILLAGAVLPPICVLFVALRFYIRRVQGSRLLTDDWLTIPALVRSLSGQSKIMWDS